MPKMVLMTPPTLVVRDYLERTGKLRSLDGARFRTIAKAGNLFLVSVEQDHVYRSESKQVGLFLVDGLKATEFERL